MPNPDRLPHLDGLRAIACLLVLWTHARIAEFPPPPVLKAGLTGVSLFFVLSGFLITRILLWNREHGIGLGAFWWRRALRILPCAWMGLILCAWVKPVASLVPAAFFYENFASILRDGGSPASHYWTLAIEEQFYLFIPLIVLFSRRSKGMVATALVLCLVSIPFVMVRLAEMGIEGGEFHKAIRRVTTSGGWLLLAGGLMAHVEKDLRSKWQPSVLLFALVSLIVYFALPTRLLSMIAAESGISRFYANVTGDLVERQLLIAAVFAACLTFRERLAFLGSGGGGSSASSASDRMACTFITCRCSTSRGSGPGMARPAWRCGHWP